MRVAAVQMAVTPDKDRNLERADQLVQQALAEGAGLVALPELFNLHGPAALLRSGAEPLDGPTLAWASAIAKSGGVWLLAGSIGERIDGDDRIYNTSCLFDPEGERVATYRKIHLFDNDVEGAVLRESATVAPGDEVVVVPVGPFTVGLGICYDLRFPELFRSLVTEGATAILLPSAFTRATGQPHWEPLVRARSIENQCYVIAPNQVATGAAHIAFHGHSCIVDPWGTVLVEAGGEDDGVVLADIEPALVERVRRDLPSLANRRPEVFEG